MRDICFKLLAPEAGGRGLPVTERALNANSVIAQIRGKLSDSAAVCCSWCETLKLGLMSQGRRAGILAWT